MEIKLFDKLPDEAKNIRITVFVEEQGFNEEFDSVDDIATHIVMYDSEEPIATCRFYIKDGSYLLGRIAVIREYRGKHIGALLISKAEEEIKKRGGRKKLSTRRQEQRTFMSNKAIPTAGNPIMKRAVRTSGFTKISDGLKKIRLSQKNIYKCLNIC